MSIHIQHIAARGGGGSFKREKIYNSEEQVPIEFVRVTCFNNARFEELFFQHVRIAGACNVSVCHFWHPSQHDPSMKTPTATRLANEVTFRGPQEHFLL